MRNKKILSAIAAVSVLSLATGVTVFAATASPEAKTTEEAVVEETTAAAEETVEETSAEAENAEEATKKAYIRENGKPPAPMLWLEEVK